MKYYNINHPDIQKALIDLKSIIGDSTQFIESIELFGSTLLIPIENAKDIDFFISYRGINFDEMRKKLLDNSNVRHVVVEEQAAYYANCPTWEKTDPLTLHIILYEKGVSHFSKKLKKTREKAVDVTNIILKNT